MIHNVGKWTLLNYWTKQNYLGVEIELFGLSKAICVGWCERIGFDGCRIFLCAGYRLDGYEKL